LEDLVFEHKATIEAGKWTQASFAEFATRRMQRPITANNVKGVAEAFTIKFCGPRPRKAGSSITELRACVEVLASELVALKHRLGETASPILLAMAGQGDGDGEASPQNVK